jgi:16S rRNA (cytidine1402-2'-O)-methyltransferase
MGTSEVVTSATLYVVATPIGNLRDITLRALEVLQQADWIAAEDTRTTGQLLKHHAISARLISLHAHNEHERAVQIVERLRAGESIALVSDAGTPAISDPGAVLVAAARGAGFSVVPVPGPSAFVAALSAAGTAGPFLFHGFLPAKAAARRSELQPLASCSCALVFYEAPHRVLDTVADLTDVLGGERKVTIARELTKLFESIYTCQLSHAHAWLSADPNRLKGEFVLIVASAPAAQEAQPGAAPELRRVLEILLEELPLKQAAALAARITEVGRNQAYAEALALRKASRDE